MSKKYIAHNSLLPFYLSWQIEPNNWHYNLSFSYHLQTKQDANLLVKNVQKLIQLQPYLRQTFTLENQKLMTIIHDELPANVHYFKISSESFPDLEERLIKNAHDIHHQSSVQLNIISLEQEESCIALFNIHHIIMDGASLESFIRDLNRLMAGEEVEHESIDTYCHSLSIEPLLEAIQDKKEESEYTHQLNEFLDKTHFSINDESDKVFHYVLTLPGVVHVKLKIFSDKYSISIFNLLLVAQGIFCAKLLNQDFFITRYPVNIRKDKSIKGCFVNLLTYPLIIAEKDTYISLLEALNNRLPFFKNITRKTISIPQLEKLPSFAESNFSKPLSIVIQEKTFESKGYAQIAHSILSIKYKEQFGELSFSLDALQGLFPEHLLSSFLRRFFMFLNMLLDNPETVIFDTDLLFREEREKILYKFNNSSSAFPDKKSIHQLFEEQVKKNPNQIALIYNEEQITYGILNSRANQLAHYLINERQLNTGDLIALYFHRNINFIIAILATLKAGAAYISLSAYSHDERIKYVLQDTKVKLILTNSEMIEKINTFIHSHEKILSIALDDNEFLLNLAKQKTLNLGKDNSSDNLSHVIYTSGTTGKPKGVMISHQNVVSLVKNVNYLKVNESDTFALISDITFDAVTFEIWGALLNGAKLFIPSSRLDLFSDGEKFSEVISIYQISVLLLTKTLFDQLFHMGETIFSKLRYLFVGGEQLNKSLINNLSISQYKPNMLVNAYGPTENTTISCTYDIYANQIKALKSIPIGTPISNRYAYILDKHLNLMPIGTTGELFVGGAGLAKGYLNQPTLTQERFIDNPFLGKNDKQRSLCPKLYKTGDLTRMHLDGNIEYIGRNDVQVKIRGYRIELGEIESRLIGYPNIKQVAVVENKWLNQNQSTEKFLIAYYIAPNEIPESLLQNYLIQLLPEYMIPKFFVYLKEIPKTISGKLDTRALPIPKWTHSALFQPPRNAKEKLICEVFSSVLSVDNVGIKDSFFSLGGDSLKAIELASILHTKFDVKVADIFELKTPEAIAKNKSLSKNHLKKQIKKIKASFKKENLQNPTGKLNKRLDYNVKVPASIEQKKDIKNILVTGATGYLGCNLVRQILRDTDYDVSLLIRSDTQENASNRFKRKFKFYFGEEIDKNYENRLFIYLSDIEKERLGVNEDTYQNLINNIDSIIHSAALTKHYGEYDKFYSANVQATLNLLELCKLTKLKDFHYISTLSTLDNNDNNYNVVYTEDDVIESLDNQPNIYIKTKYEAEKKVISYRNKGINTNVYRVGNLAFISTNFRVQENIEDNAFFTRIKCLVTLKTAPREIGLEEISPVDLTAEAILKIFNKISLTNGIYHVFNPNFCNIVDLFVQLDPASLNVISIDNFLDLLTHYLDKPGIHNKLIMRFLLHQGWLDGKSNAQNIHQRILQERTNNILKKLGFNWPVITKKIFATFIRKAYLLNH